MYKLILYCEIGGGWVGGGAVFTVTVLTRCFQMLSL